MKSAKRISTTTELIGWVGVILVVGAFGALSVNLVIPQNIWYILANILGSLAIMYEAYKKKDYQPVILNLIWLIFALVSLIRAL